MFLWRNLLIVGAVFILTTCALLAVERDPLHRQWMKLMLAAVLAVLVVLMGPVPYGLTLVALMVAFAALVMRGVPPIASYLTITAVSPMLDFNVAGFAGIETLAHMTTPFVVGGAALLMWFLTPRYFERRGWQAADVTVLVFMFAYWALIFRGSNATSLLRHSVEIVLPMAGAYVVASRGRLGSGVFLLKTFGFLALPLALVGAFEAVTVWPQFRHVAAIKNLPIYWGYEIRMGMFRALASFVDPIAFSLFLSAAFVAVWGLWVAGFNRIMTIVAGVVVLVGLTLTFSRTGGVALIAGMAALMLLRRRFSELGALLGLAGLGLLLNSFLPETTRVGSSNYRINLAPAVWGAIKDNPLTGDNLAVEAGKLDSIRQGQGIVDIVNAYLGFALEGGFILVACFVAMPVAAFIASRRLRRSKRSATQILLAEVVLAQLIGWSIGIYFTSLTDKNLYYLIVFSGLAVAVSRARERSSIEAPFRWRKPLVVPPPHSPQVGQLR